MGAILPFIPAALGVASSLGLFGTGAKKGKKVEYEAQAPEYQQKFAKEFFEYLQGQVGQGATPYGGQVAAPFVNPFTQGAFGAMKASPYGSMMGDLPMGGMPFVPPQMSPQAPAPVGAPGLGTPWEKVAQMPGMFGQMGEMVNRLIAPQGTPQATPRAPQQPMGPRQGPQPFKRGGPSPRMMR